MTAANIAQPPDSRDPGHSTLTSLAQLFGQTINGMQVQAIKIPLFQRDYAQGRHSQQARLVRTRFIADLCAALDGDQVLHLDFVFGDVVEGTLYPLDGQQRLTTLFLLHCYLAWHQQDQSPQPWHAFHYATRPGARKFCEFLTQCRPDMATENLSAWLRDQARYLPTWKHDPTIQGMLVVLDVFHEHYRGRGQACLDAAWIRLTKEQAIRFLLLPVAAQKLDNTLYVKMNSRGRPLTEFENFKAELEALLHRNPAIDPADAKVFSEKIDTDWSDLFWGYRGDDRLIDEEFMRYLRFLMEVRACPIRQNSCRLDRTKNLGAAKKDENGPIRTSIQRQGAGPLAGARERSAARGRARAGRWGLDPRTLARAGTEQTGPRAGLECRQSTRSRHHHGGPQRGRQERVVPRARRIPERA